MNLERLSPDFRLDDIDFKEIMEYAVQQFDLAEEDRYGR